MFFDRSIQFSKGNPVARQPTGHTNQAARRHDKEMDRTGSLLEEAKRGEAFAAIAETSHESS